MWVNLTMLLGFFSFGFGEWSPTNDVFNCYFKFKTFFHIPLVYNVFLKKVMEL